MIRFLAVIVPVVSFAYWLLRWRAGLREKKGGTESRQVANIGVEINTPKVESLPGLRPAEEPREESDKNDIGDVAPEQPGRTEAELSASFESEPEVPNNDRSSADVSYGDSTAPVVANDQPSSSEHAPRAVVVSVVPPLFSETKLEVLAPAVALGKSDISVENSSVKAALSTVAMLDAIGNGLQAVPLIPEKEFAETAVQPSDVASFEPGGEKESPAPPVVEESVVDQEEKVPLLYHTPRQRLPRLAPRRPANQQEKPRSVPSETPLEIQVGAIFDRFGFCSVGLLPKRSEDLDDDIDAKDGRAAVHLCVLDEWYQELQFADIGDKLLHGFELKAELPNRRQVRWRLSGRAVYVLAAHQGTNKLVSTPRLHVDRPDVVLCTVEILPKVEAVLSSSGCEGYTRFDESYGAPRGWIGLRGVVPKEGLLLEDNDPFYALKPEADIQIALDGGIYLLNSVWLAGYPPEIRIVGKSDVPVKVLIDGELAQLTDAGAFTAEGYDAPGQHSVYCEGLARSCSYSIEEAPESWEEWRAYSFGQADICGPLVELRDDAAKQRSFAVPMSNPLLLGAEPGQVFRCTLRKSARWKGYVPFDVVWALPPQPLISNKKTARILQFGEALPSPTKVRAKSEAAWCNAILDASRKGLRIANASDSSTACWREYRKAARNIRKGRR